MTDTNKEVEKMIGYWIELVGSALLVAGLIFIKGKAFDETNFKWPIYCLPDAIQQALWQMRKVILKIIAIVILLLFTLPRIVDIPYAIFGWYSTTTGVAYVSYDKNHKQSSVQVNGVWYDLRWQKDLGKGNACKIEYLPHSRFGVSATVINGK